VGVAGRDEAGVGRAENKLVELTILALDAQASTVGVHGDDNATLDAAAEVLDAGVAPNARDGS
jgi:hypothetical protein